MPDIPSFSDLFRVGRDEVLSKNAKLSRDAVEREGMDANILVAAAAAMADEVAGQVAELQAAIFLDSAKRDALDRLVFDRYGLIRKAAAASVGSVQFSTSSVSTVTFDIPVNTVLQTASGIQFVTSESATFLVNSVGPYTVAVRSVLAGSGLNAKSGEITSIVSQIPSSPADLVVTNQLATFGADNAEEDEALRDRAKRFFTTARRGTLAAIEAAALGVSGVNTATAFEALDAFGRPARYIQLVVADAFTKQFIRYDTVPPQFEVQSQVISSAVFSALDDVRPAGVFVNVQVANVVIQAVQLALAFEAGADVSSTALQARSAVVNYINGRSPGDTMVAADILAVLELIPGLNYTGNELVSPVGDVVPQPLEVIRTSLALVSAVSSQTDQPIITGNNPDAIILASG